MKKTLLIFTCIFLPFASYPQSCLPSGIDFNFQSEIDNFQANYPGCTEIEGNVEIDGNNIQNLNGLSVLTSIGGYLYISNNDSLVDITGLASLASVGGSLLISSNPVLASFNGLQSLSVVEEDVFISNNPLLSDISALGSIIAANVMELRISGNSSLAICDNPFICNYLSNPPDKVNIYNNSPGCNNPPEIAEECGITIPCLPFGNYNFFTQEEIDDFQVHYPDCNTLAGVVKISGSDISNLEGLIAVDSINGSAEIHNNPLLTSLSGLDSLVLIDGTITIVGNTILTDISALNDLDTSVISFLGINNNPMLSECNIQSFCDYLFGPFGSSHYNIVGNDDGCKNRDEVLLACTVGFEDAEDKGASFQLSPNPATTLITISVVEKSSQFLISIFNSNGQEVLRKTSEESSTVVDISNLNPGIYFVRLAGEKSVGVEKFVKLD
jgi:hypothetical protein